MTPEQERAKLDTTLRAERDWAIKNEQTPQPEEWRDFSAECDDIRRKMRAKLFTLPDEYRDEVQHLYYRSITLSEHEAARRVWVNAREVLHAADQAINPPDRSGISLDKWNQRLKAATAKIHEFLNPA